MVLVHSVTKEADTAELSLFQGCVAELLMDMGMLVAEKMG